MRVWMESLISSRPRARVARVGACCGRPSPEGLSFAVQLRASRVAHGMRVVLSEATYVLTLLGQPGILALVATEGGGYVASGFEIVGAARVSLQAELPGDVVFRSSRLSAC
jgi:hypothetical protein